MGGVDWSSPWRCGSPARRSTKVRRDFSLGVVLVLLGYLNQGSVRMSRWVAGPIVVRCLVALPSVASAATPAVSTQPATAISNTRATLNATINPAGQRTTYAFQYGQTTGYGAQTAFHSAGSGTVAVKVKATLGGLIPGTVYHFRIVAGNASGLSVGRDRAFRTTGRPPPTVVTGPAINAGRQGATLTGFVNPMGLASNFRFQFGLSPFYGLQTNPVSLPPSNAVLPVSFGVGGLAAHRLYHYRLVASTSSGTIAGSDAVFDTGRFAPRGVTRNTTPRRLRSRPYVLTTTGRVRLPSGFPPVFACKGVVRIRYQTARRTLVNVVVPLNGACRYFTRVTIRRSITGSFRVRARFLGNALLTPHSARSQRIRVG